MLNSVHSNSNKTVHITTAASEWRCPSLQRLMACSHHGIRVVLAMSSCWAGAGHRAVASNTHSAVWVLQPLTVTFVLIYIWFSLQTMGIAWHTSCTFALWQLFELHGRCMNHWWSYPLFSEWPGKWEITLLFFFNNKGMRNENIQVKNNTTIEGAMGWVQQQLAH